MPEIRKSAALIESTVISEEEKSERIEKLRLLVADSIYKETRTDDIFLMRFLFCCDWDVDAAFNRITRMMQHRRNHPKWFINHNVTDTRQILNKNIKTVLNDRDKNGRRIYLTRLGNISSNVQANDLAQLDDLWFNYILDEFETIQKGVSVIIDMRGASWRILRLLSPGNVKIAAQTADLVPIKHMEFHIVNSSALLNSAVALIFPFLGQRLKDQIHFHYSNMESLHEYLGKEALPEEYGGRQNVTIEYETLYKNVLCHNDCCKKFSEGTSILNELEKENLLRQDKLYKI